MKKITTTQKFSILFILFISTLFYNDAHGQACKAKYIAKTAKANITPPYKYDSYAMTEVVFDKKREKKIRVNFTAFEDMKYKIAFLHSDFQEAVTVNIFDKSAAMKDRKKVYDSSQGIDNDYWVYDTTIPGRYYIEYQIPKSLTGEERTGCIVMLIGYTDVEPKEDALAIKKSK